MVRRHNPWLHCRREDTGSAGLPAVCQHEKTGNCLRLTRLSVKGGEGGRFVEGVCEAD